MQLLSFLAAGLVAATGVHSFGIGISGVALGLVLVLAQAAPFIPETASSNLKRQDGRCRSRNPADCQKEETRERSGGAVVAAEAAAGPEDEDLEERQGGRCQSADPRDCQKDKREELDAARLEDEEEEK
ncbi:hypothetical protein CH63R_09246 [Colletotrichum higginsianum IMI 349063]|uniref:Uncharacterized protein n=1 Tax=Colletotrichum higginsianum (strain IMI 349063) TaxID=759273 RepID=A0A1B7Y6W7_COLHI|nr:hypothetical protein CH63R_09246 [Colletotrichum higginsianum IMI 349063]OBR07725.1 hypothetical protein CH63R_09246 [Colletotrichum higginsianum IMI 349063]